MRPGARVLLHQWLQTYRASDSIRNPATLVIPDRGEPTGRVKLFSYLGGFGDYDKKNRTRLKTPPIVQKPLIPMLTPVELLQHSSSIPAAP
jgi:hypothetical protein